MNYRNKYRKGKNRDLHRYLPRGPRSSRATFHLSSLPLTASRGDLLTFTRMIFCFSPSLGLLRSQRLTLVGVTLLIDDARSSLFCATSWVTSGSPSNVPPSEMYDSELNMIQACSRIIRRDFFSPTVGKWRLDWNNLQEKNKAESAPLFNHHTIARLEYCAENRTAVRRR